MPTQIGGGRFITSGSILIKPVARWLIYSNAPDPASERLTGITMQILGATSRRRMRIPGEVGRRFRNEVGHCFRSDVGHSDLKSATPI